MSTFIKLKTAIASIAVAAVAASILTTSGAVNVPAIDKMSDSGKLAQICGVEYDKSTYRELHHVLNKQAAAILNLGLGTTKDDVCTVVKEVVNNKTDKKVDTEDYAASAYIARATVGAAIVYQASIANKELTRENLYNMAIGLNVEHKGVNNWQPGRIKDNIIREAGIQFIKTNLNDAGRSDIDSSRMKDKGFSDFTYALNLDIAH